MKKFYVCVFLFVILLMQPRFAFAQQTIITVPSSDVLPSGEVALKESTRFTPWHDSFVSITPTLIIGTGKDTETSIGVGTTIEDKTSVKLDIATKKVFKLNESTRLTIGGRLSPNLTDGKNPNSFLYAHSSYIIKPTKTTVTSGMYLMGKGDAPDRAGVILGLDQTIIPKKLRFVAEWMSRQDTGSSLGAGFKIRPRPQTSLTTAILVPNCGQDRVAFSISISQYIGKIFDYSKKEKENL